MTDILDVWFDSGCTHVFTLEGNPDLKWPADLYLEGSDQHRGWFHSSLLESCGTRGRAPYDGVLTHGFTLDEQGRKMSKSLGNITAPQDVCDQYGADILRLWVVGTDYTEDQRIGPEILKHQAEAYRRLRNTLRYLLGSLDGYSAAEQVAYADMPGAGALGAASPGRARRRCSGRRSTISTSTRSPPSCTISAPSISRPSISTSARTRSTATRPTALRRRAARTVMAELFSFLTAWLAPITCFTAEEAWLARPEDMPDGGQRACICALYPEIPAAWLDAGAGREVEDRCARCAASSPARSSSSAPRSASARACRPPRTSMPRRNTSRRMKGLDLCRDLHHLGRRAGRRRGRQRRFQPARRGRRRRRAACWPTATNVHAAGRCWRRSASRPGTRCSAGAAKRRWTSMTLMRDRSPGDGPASSPPWWPTRSPSSCCWVTC